MPDPSSSISLVYIGVTVFAAATIGAAVGTYVVLSMKRFDTRKLLSSSLDPLWCATIGAAATNEKEFKKIACDSKSYGLVNCCHYVGPKIPGRYDETQCDANNCG